MSKKSAVYSKQSPLKGSLREVRGILLKRIGAAPVTRGQLQRELPKDMHERIDRALAALVLEGFVEKKRAVYLLVE